MKEGIFFLKGSQSHTATMRANFLLIVCLPVDKIKSFKGLSSKAAYMWCKICIFCGFFSPKVGLCGLKVACFGPNFSSEIEKWR